MQIIQHALCRVVMYMGHLSNSMHHSCIIGMVGMVIAAAVVWYIIYIEIHRFVFPAWLGFQPSGAPGRTA